MEIQRSSFMDDFPVSLALSGSRKIGEKTGDLS